MVIISLGPGAGGAVSGPGTGGAVSGPGPGGAVSGPGTGGSDSGVMGTHSTGVGASLELLELLTPDPFELVDDEPPLEEDDEPTLLDFEPLLETPDALPLLPPGSIIIVPAGQTSVTSTHYLVELVFSDCCCGY